MNRQADLMRLSNSMAPIAVLHLAYPVLHLVKEQIDILQNEVPGNQ